MSESKTERNSDPIVAENVKLDAQNVQELLLKKRIHVMSRKKKITLFLGILIIIAASGFGAYKWLVSSKTTTYPTATVTKATITDSIEATGTLEAIKESAMGFKNNATITAINVEPGDKVKKGQILAQQDTANLQSALQQAQSSVEQDQISLKTNNLTLETDRRDLERKQKLFAAGALAQTDLDTAQDTYTKSELALATSKSKLVNDQAKVAEAQSDLEGATLVAPFDGIIGEVNGQVGQINGIDASSSTLLTILSEDLQLSALVNEADIGRIKVGQDVEFTTSAYSNKTFKGKVLRITPQASTVSSVQYYPVLISCSDPDNQLLSGMSVSANIIVARKSDALAVSMMAVSYAQSYIKSNPSTTANNAQSTSPGSQTNTQSTVSGSSSSTSTTTEQTTSSVLVLQSNQPVVKTVVLGLNDGSNYEVISGLNDGDKVIVGSSQTDTTSASSGTSSSSSSKTTKSQNQGGGGMGGPPPGGF